MTNVIGPLEKYIFEYEEKDPEMSERNHRRRNPPNPL
jgi:hypothetical protein